MKVDNQETSKTIYSIGLHETITISEGFLVTRVAGGWIYEIQKPQVNVLEIIFIPFNNEFMIVEK
jgi:hypothetical protein